MFEATTFRLRETLFGKWRLRRSLPTPLTGARLADERKFYWMVLERSGISRAAEQVVDVGCRNWSYAQTLADWFQNARIIGVEVDGGRRYWNLHRRIDQAEAQAAQLRRNGRMIECLHADFRNLPLERYLLPNHSAAFCFFFPFVSERPCRRWGLPTEFSRFESLLERVPSGAAIVSCHQGEWEAEIAREAYHRIRKDIAETVVNPNDFKGLWPSTHPVHVLLAKS